MLFYFAKQKVTNNLLFVSRHAIPSYDDTTALRPAGAQVPTPCDPGAGGVLQYAV